MSSRKTEIALLVTLLIVGVAFYVARWYLFPGSALHNEMWRFLVGDIGFLLLQVAIVTLLIDGMLRARERQAVRLKLNMVIGAFFSEVGTELLGQLALMDTMLAEVRSGLIPQAGWTRGDYTKAESVLGEHRLAMDISACDLQALKATLAAEKPFLLGLLGNQALLEHEGFTDLLWAVTHLSEELSARETFEDVPEADRTHLAGDAKRAYSLLTKEWLEYMQHLQTQYPYLFSLAVRTNPFDPRASATVKA